MNEIKLKQKRKAHSEETKKKMRESALNAENRLSKELYDRNMK